MTTPRRRTFLAAAALFGFAPALATAQPCPPTLAHPAKAKSISASLVQAFVACDAELGGNTPNATTETGTVPSCYPAETFHVASGSPTDGWTWGPKSKGSVRLSAGKNKLSHPLNTDPDARDVFLTISLSDVRDQDGRADGTMGSAVTLIRATLIDRDEPSMPMTIVDFPVSTTFPITNGKVVHKTSITAYLNEQMEPAFPRCTSIELLGFQVKDPSSNAFATIGVYLP